MKKLTFLFLMSLSLTSLVSCSNQAQNEAVEVETTDSISMETQIDTSQSVNDTIY